MHPIPLLLSACILSAILTRPVGAESKYAIVVSEATAANDEWKPVVDALVAKHKAHIVTFSADVEQSLADLRAQFPRYVCFVATSAEASRDFVARVHRLTRQLDDDIYTDAQWGILTGYSADDALRIARQLQPLKVSKVASGTEIELNKCREGVWYSELTQRHMMRKERGQTPTESEGPDDTTEPLVNCLNQYQADLFITSGHATERDWQIGFRYRNGSFQSKAGKLFGVDTAGKQLPISSPNTKVYLPIGNCLMGHIDGSDAMALAWMHSAGVTQMIGYTVPTWYGYGGWGLLDYFVEQPGRYTFSEAFYANHQALLHRLETNFPGLAGTEAQAINEKIEETQQSRNHGLTANDARGLLYDRDTVAFYGDPAWQAIMAPDVCAFDLDFTQQGNRYVLKIKPRDKKSFEAVNTNGSQRGGRPIVRLFPQRIDVKSLKIVAGAELAPMITDNFLLVPLPEKSAPEQAYRVELEARTLP